MQKLRVFQIKLGTSVLVGESNDIPLRIKKMAYFLMRAGVDMDLGSRSSPWPKIPFILHILTHFEVALNIGPSYYS
jgi:hypothetical protein